MDPGNSGNKCKDKGFYDDSKVIGTYTGKDICASSFPADKKIGVKLYDFRRPDKFSREQIRTLSVIHDTFTRLSTASLSTMLRCLCECHFGSVDQMTFEEFIHGIPSPTTIAVINMDPLKGSALLQIDNTLTFPIIERLAGRKDVVRPEYNRDLTEIERACMEGIAVRLLKNIQEAWSTVVTLTPRISQMETNPQFAQIVPPPEMVIIVEIKCKIQTVESRMTLCFPYLTIEPIIPRLSAKYWYASVRRNDSVEATVPVSQLKTDSFVFFESEKLSLTRLYNLSQGSLIKMPGLKKGEAYLSCSRERLLKLELDKAKGNGRSFKIIPGKIDKADSFDSFLMKTNNNSEKTQAQQMIDTVTEVLQSFEGKFTRGFSEIEKQIKELTARQDVLSDQLYFGSAEKELQEESEKSVRPFHFLHSIEKEHIYNFINKEHPQVIALILAFLEPFYSAEILGRFPAKLQVDIAERIATMERTAPQVLKEIERVLKKKFAMTDKITTAGGIDFVVDIINHIGRSVEKTIIGGLEKKDSKLAQAIKKKMFLFEYVRLLDPRALKAVIEKTKIKDIVVALKGCSSEVKDHLLSCLNDKDREVVTKKLKEIGPVRIQDVETAQQGIIETIRKLENEGVIVIAYAGEVVE